MAETIRARQTFQDTVFRDLFGTERNKRHALELYNALNNTAYDNPDELRLNMLGDALFLTVRNDVSFVIGHEQVLWEHQSTHNPNMPLRGLEYFSSLYSKEIRKEGADRFGSKPIRISTPRYVVFYSGKSERPDGEEMRLSQLYEGEGDLEVRVTVLNINVGHNRALLEACETLRGYATLVQRIRDERAAGKDLSDAVLSAVNTCIKGGILKAYLEERKESVVGMFIGQLTAEEAMEEMRNGSYRAGVEEGIEIGREEGIAIGREKERQEMVAKMIEIGNLTAAEALELFGVSVGDNAPAHEA